MIKMKKLLEEKVDISDISWNHQKLLKVGGDYIHKTRDGKLWYELQDDINKSKNRTLIKYFKEYEKARLKLSQAGSMLTRAFIVGRVSMDIITVDIGDKDIKVGDAYKSTSHIGLWLLLYIEKNQEVELLL